MFANYSAKSVLKSCPIMILLCLAVSAQISAKPMPRFQRRAYQDGLLSGLTNTGTSFGSTKYPMDYGYPQQQTKGEWPTYEAPYDEMASYKMKYRDSPVDDGAADYGMGGRYGGDWRGFGMGKNPYGAYPAQRGLKY